MNIAYVNTSYRLGGGETVTHDLMQGVDAAGHATRVYVAMGKTYPRDPDLRLLYPRVLSRLHHSRLRSVVERWAPRAAWTDRRFRSLATGWPDLVHIHNFHGDYATVASLAHVARHKPVVWTFHGHWGVTGGCDHPLECTRYQDECGQCPRLGVWPLGLVDDTAARLQEKLEYLATLPLHIVAPARYLAERIARSRVGRAWQIHHVPNGVSLRTFSAARKHSPIFRRSLGIDSTAVVILLVNRNFRDPQKGFTTVRDALWRINAGALPLQVVLAGQECEWAAAQLPLSVRPLCAGFLNVRDEMALRFEAADVLLFASPAENFPCVVLEAMAAGCCVVSTPTSGVTEQIEDGRTGLLAADISAPALAAVLNTAITSPPLRDTLGRAARQDVISRYSVDRMVRRYLDVYETAVAARAGAMPAPLVGAAVGSAAR